MLHMAIKHGVQDMSRKLEKNYITKMKLKHPGKLMFIDAQLFQLAWGHVYAVLASTPSGIHI